MDKKLKAFERLLIIMDELREQCPWDRKQTWQSLRNLSIEEMYELADAILEEDTDEVKEELGDIMIYLIRLSDKLDINLEQAVIDKMKINEEKYPIELSKGNSTKYNKR